MFGIRSYRDARKWFHVLAAFLLLVSSAGAVSVVQAQSANSVLITPLPIDPTGTIDGVTRPTFTWTAFPGAAFYRLAVFSQETASPLSMESAASPSIAGESLVSADCGFYIILENIPVSNCTDTECSFQSSVNFSNGEYRWKVLASTAAGPTDYSDWATFNVTGVTLPAPTVPPILIGPNGVVSTHRPTFTWNAAEYASFYRLAVYSYATGSYVVVENVYPSCVGGVCSYTPSTWDLVNGSYGFKMRSRNSLGYTDFGSMLNFSVSSNLPVAPTLLGPTGTVGANPPAFQWNAVDGATSYRLAVYSYVTGSYIITETVPPTACSGGVCTYVPIASLASGNYKFKILTSNAYGISGYSGFMSFTVP